MSAGDSSGGSRKRPLPSAAERSGGEGAADGCDEEERPTRDVAGSSDGAERGAGGRQARRRKVLGSRLRAEHSTPPLPLHPEP